MCSSILMASGTANAKLSDQMPYKRIYIGFGLGLNCDYGLIGLGLKFRPHPNVMLSGSGGLGSWGFKTGANAIYLFKSDESSFGLGLGASAASGLGNALLETKLPDESSNQQTAKVQVNSVVLCNIMATQQWVFKNSGHRIFIDFGYGIPVTGDAYKIISGPSGSNAKQVMNILKPAD